MPDLKEDFLQAIHQKNIVSLTFNSKEKGIITRSCVPFDFGPSKRNLSFNPDKYHFHDLDSPAGAHTLSILPQQIISMKVLEQKFSPADCVTWQGPYDWFIPRDWGIYS